MSNCDCSIEIEAKEQSRVIIAGTLVHVMESRLPDLLIGLAIVLLVLKGGLAIISDARNKRMINVLSTRLVVRRTLFRFSFYPDGYRRTRLIPLVSG